MTRPLSNDLRERVVAAVLSGESRRSAAKRFGISVSAAVKLLQRHRATGSVAPGKMGGHRKRVLEPHRAFIEVRMRETPHLTLHGLQDELAGRAGSRSCTTRCGSSCAARVWASKKRCSPLSRCALILPADANDGDPGRPASIRGAWSSSMRPGSRPTWLRCAVGDRRASGYAAWLRTAIGAR